MADKIREDFIESSLLFAESASEAASVRNILFQYMMSSAHPTIKRRYDFELTSFLDETIAAGRHKDTRQASALLLLKAAKALHRGEFPLFECVIGCR
jgi:hypothetical protein